jgi:shikimate kinase
MNQPQPAAPATVHLVLQGKGGVGKSFVSAILAQYLRPKSASLHCLDTDPVNATFAQYSQLKAEHVNILKRGNIHEKEFDVLVDRICKNTGTFVIDTGATTFLPLWNYILENEILQFLASSSRRVFVHCVIAGGQSMRDTLNGFRRIAETTTEKNVVAWLNEYFGEVVAGGEPFEDFDVAKEHAAKLLGSVVLEERNANSYGEDIRQMLKQRLTFDEAIRSADFTLVSKQRLTIVRRAVFEQLDLLALT